MVGADLFPCRFFFFLFLCFWLLRERPVGMPLPVSKPAENAELSPKRGFQTRMWSTKMERAPNAYKSDWPPLPEVPTQKKSHPYHNRNPWHTSHATSAHISFQPLLFPPLPILFLVDIALNTWTHVCYLSDFLQNLLRLRGSTLINIPLVVDQKGSLHSLLNSLTFTKVTLQGRL